eukprot:Skav220658  [mRNA]  locus=scaffold2604:19912:20550:- [translate_table: standard]
MDPAPDSAEQSIAHPVSLREQVPNNWESVEPISREDQGVKPKGRPRKTKSKQNQAEESSKKKSRKTTHKKVDDSKATLEEQADTETKPKVPRSKKPKTSPKKKVSPKKKAAKAKPAPKWASKSRAASSSTKRASPASSPSAPSSASSTSTDTSGSPSVNYEFIVASLPFGTVLLQTLLTPADYENWRYANMIDLRQRFAVSAKNINRFPFQE